MFSCNALRATGLSDDFADHYWRDLFGQPTYPLDNVLSDSGDVPLKFWSTAYATEEQRLEGERRCLAVRLMMLAWLHEMVRTGEFDRIAPPEERS